MKILYLFVISSLVFTFAGCDRSHKTTETNKITNEVTKKIITLTDFRKIKGVDNVQDVPFQLFTKLDSVHFFMAPSKDADHLKVAKNKLDNYYGFEEFDDFYAIHFSIDNNISNSIEAFVLKSEFTASFDMTLAGKDLYEIRSSLLKKSQDFKNKSFRKFGKIVEVSAQEFKTASKNRIDEELVKNPKVKLKDGNWVYTEDGKQIVIVQHENVSTEEGMLSNEYIGQCSTLNLEVFKENSPEVYDLYYSFYDIKPKVSFRTFTAGYPQIIPNKNWISYVNSNNDVGSDFTINKYAEQVSDQENLLYINFTNFKIADQTKAFWADNETFYAEVYPTNSAPSKNKKQRASYIKIQLKPNLF
jgi:hypothetical protein